MRVVCDNCSAVYKIPDEKLVKPVNKATCRACGHRMLIPRPPPPDDFEDEERTLIKERPLGVPTPMMSDSGDRVTVPIEQDEPEATLPRARPPIPLPPSPRPQKSEARARPRPQYPEIPPPKPAAHRRPTPSYPVFKDLDEETVWVKNPPTGARRRRFDPGTIAPDEQPTRPALPPPIPIQDKATPTAVQERKATPRPSKARPVEQVEHDPAGDMSLILLATLATVIGVIILAIDLPTGSHWADLGISLLGVTLALAGLFTTMLVVLTSARGRRPAQGVLALFVGVFAATVIGGALVAGRAGLQHLSGASPLWAEEQPEPSTATVLGAPLQTPAIEEPEAPAVEEEVADAEPTEPPDDGMETEVVMAPPPPARTATTRPRPAPAPRPTTTRPVRTTERITPPPAPIPEPEPTSDLFDTEDDFLLDDVSDVLADAEPEPPPPPPRVSVPEPEPEPGVMETVPMEALDVMLRNNLEVKKCFFTFMQAEGALPSRVDVRFTLETHGRATGVTVTQ
ncbi:MAG: zinc-ribbon domain-containing protein, partial [Deltaproteobacteria bacterium]|nr:zinc-ribbon domain-containing protein [Deltaproteobacteria bacterium]